MKVVGDMNTGFSRKEHKRRQDGSIHKYALGSCQVSSIVLDLERERSKQMFQIPALTELPV